MSGESLAQWMQREYRYAATAMLRSISPVGIVKQRPGFGQVVTPVKGAVIASPVLGAYDPDPDYFFHWFRDSAVVMESLRLLHLDGSVGDEALTHFGDFVRFSLALHKLDGRAVAAQAGRRDGVAADFMQYTREDADLQGTHGSRVYGETRVNPDGTLDVSRWARPQHDGPPLLALTLLRWARSHTLEMGLALDLGALIRSQLAFTHDHWREPSYDIWEEDCGDHYYTLRVSLAALEQGAGWFDEQGERAQAHACREQAQQIAQRLQGFWLEREGYYRSRVLADGQRTVKELDIAVILSAIHAQAKGGVHTVDDPRMHATLSQLDALFDRLYAINHGRTAGRGPAMGRYEGDVYLSGGAYYFSSLGAAEFCYRAAQGAPDAEAWVARGDAYLQTVRAYTPASGDLSEQFDQTTGEQTSAKHLAWSYAALVSTVATRRAVAG